eukprot:690963-Lingulodinium_polyedra.AAC.1
MRAQVLAQRGITRAGTALLRAGALVDEETAAVVVRPLVMWHRELWDAVEDGNASSKGITVGQLQEAWCQVAAKAPRSH